MTNKKQGFILMMSVVLTLFLGILLGAALLRTQFQMQEGDRRIASQAAFYAAESGLEQALFQYRRNPDWRPEVDEQGLPRFIDLNISPTDPTNVGSYSIEAVDAPDIDSLRSKWVKVIGGDPVSESARSIRCIMARVIVDSPAAFFVSTMGDLRIGSGTNINSDIFGNNIFFDVNGTLADSDPMKSINITGDVLYVANLFGDTGANAPFVHTGEKIPFSNATFAGVNTDYYRNRAQASDGNGGTLGRYVNGDFSYSGDLDKNSLGASNGLVFVEGNVNISGIIKDDILIVAGGNIYIRGDLMPYDTNPSTAAQLGLLASKDIFIPDSSQKTININAFLMADGHGSDSKGGVFIAEGAKGSKDAINFNGIMALRGVVPGTGGSVPTAVDLNVYKVRNYLYNDQLQNNRRIPLLPGIASVMHWQEVNPDEPFPVPPPA